MGVLGFRDLGFRGALGVEGFLGFGVCRAWGAILFGSDWRIEAVPKSREYTRK